MCCDSLAVCALAHSPSNLMGCSVEIFSIVLRRDVGITTTVVVGNGRSCGALSAVILGLMCAPLIWWWHLDMTQWKALYDWIHR